MYEMTLKTLGSLMLAVSLPAWGQQLDHPRNGIAFNTKDNHAITYACQLDGSGVLNCEFSQSIIRAKYRPQELEAQYQSALKQFRAGTEQPDPDSCKLFKQLDDVLTGRTKAPDPSKLAAVSQKQRDDSARTARAFLEYCKSPSEPNFRAVLELDRDKKSRTCEVSSRRFDQRFSPLAGQGKAPVWVVQDQPSGVCGTIRLDRFSPEPSSTGMMTFWSYSARQVVTNPSGVWLPGAPDIRCSEIDQAEYLYDWRGREVQLSCDYISFSPI